MGNAVILISKEIRKELKLFAVRNDISMGNAIQLLLDKEKEWRRL